MEPTPEELAAMAKARPTRNLVTRHCVTCHYEWLQPSPTGKCPKCYSDRVENISHRISGLKTV